MFDKCVATKLCACMGPMYGEPYCPCRMSAMGFDKQMEENPLRIAENERAKKQLDALFGEGGRYWKAKEQ